MSTRLVYPSDIAELQTLPSVVPGTDAEEKGSIYEARYGKYDTCASVLFRGLMNGQFPEQIVFDFEKTDRLQDWAHPALLRTLLAHTPVKDKAYVVGLLYWLHEVGHLVSLHKEQAMAERLGWPAQDAAWVLDSTSAFLFQTAAVYTIRQQPLMHAVRFAHRRVMHELARRYCTGNDRSTEAKCAALADALVGLHGNNAALAFIAMSRNREMPAQALAVVDEYRAKYTALAGNPRFVDAHDLANQIEELITQATRLRRE